MRWLLNGHSVFRRHTLCPCLGIKNLYRAIQRTCGLLGFTLQGGIQFEPPPNVIYLNERKKNLLGVAEPYLHHKSERKSNLLYNMF